MKKTDRPTLSIIIVKYHAEEYLRQCLDSIKKDSQWEVIVVDNDKENIGYGAGCNKGAVTAKGEYLLFLNPDTKILDEAIGKMVGLLKKNPSISVVGPKLYKNDKKEKLLSFCRFPDPLTSLFVFSPLKSFWQNNPLFNRYVYGENKKDNGVLDVEAVAGAAILVRKEAFEKVGGFDENFFLYFEENDLCRRIKKQGGKIVYFPAAEVIHFVGGSTTHGLLVSREFKKSRRYFFRKHYGLVTGLLTDRLIRFLETMANFRRNLKKANEKLS